jgi:hydroxyacylglutathione hydrolase
MSPDPEIPPMTAPFQIRTLVSMPFEENTYIAWLHGRGDAVVIDPGLEPEAILDVLRDEGLTTAALLKAAFPSAPLIIGARDTALLASAELNLSAAFGFPIVSPPADRTVAEGDVVEAAGLRFEVFDIPGHSPGHVVFVFRGPPCLVFGGDVLFRGGIGRTDFPGGDGPLLFDGIRNKLYTLPADTVVYPGHGPVTTVGHERRTNPFVTG